MTRYRVRGRLVAVIALGVLALVLGGNAAAQPAPDLGSNVIVFDPSMPTSQIQATVDAIAAQQVPNQFGTQRYALLFKPGTYGSADASAQLPGRLLHRGGRARPLARATSSSTGRSTCATSATRGGCVALNNFWRSLSNLTINVTTPGLRLLHRRVLGRVAGGADAPRRTSTAHDADGLLHRPVVRERRLHRRLAFDGSRSSTARSSSGYVRNSTLGGWTNGVWNQVFSGVVGAPAQCFPAVRTAAAPTRRSRPAR